MRPLLAVVLDDGLFATVIGASFVMCLSLMAYIVKKLGDIDGRVKVLEWAVGTMNNGHAPMRSQTDATSPDR